jgi:hypothetical protein
MLHFIRGLIGVLWWLVRLVIRERKESAAQTATEHTALHDPGATLPQLIQRWPEEVHEWLRREDCWVFGAAGRDLDGDKLGPFVVPGPDGVDQVVFGKLPECRASIVALRTWVRERHRTGLTQRGSRSGSPR